MSELIVRKNQTDDSYIDFFRERTTARGQKALDFLWAIHIDSFDDEIPWKTWNEVDELRVSIEVIKGD